MGFSADLKESSGDNDNISTKGFSCPLPSPIVFPLILILLEVPQWKFSKLFLGRKNKTKHIYILDPNGSRAQRYGCLGCCIPSSFARAALGKDQWPPVSGRLQTQALILFLSLKWLCPTHFSFVGLRCVFLYKDWTRFLNSPVTMRPRMHTELQPLLQ